MATAMSREGYEKLKADLEKLEAGIGPMREAVKEAREKGDLSENAEYHAAREQLAQATAKIAHIQGQLQGAEIINQAKIDAAAGRVVFGSTVKVKDLDSGREDTYHLVGPGEVDVLENRILTTSPIGQALIAKVVGDEVEVQVPRGLMRLRVEEIG